MFLAIYSNEMKIGMGINDKTLVITEASDLEEANEIADEYAQDNEIQYTAMDVIDLSDCDVI